MPNSDIFLNYVTTDINVIFRTNNKEEIIFNVTPNEEDIFLGFEEVLLEDENEYILGSSHCKFENIGHGRILYLNV